MKCNEGLLLAANHLLDTLTPLDQLWLRPGWRSTEHTLLSLRWDFPTGGNVSMTVGFDVKHLGPRAEATLVPRVTLSASIGCALEDADTFTTVLASASAAGRRVLALLRREDFEP